MRLEECKDFLLVAMRYEWPNGTLITQIGLMTATFSCPCPLTDPEICGKAGVLAQECRDFCGKKQVDIKKYYK